jgi:hypothetical protein
MKLFQTRVQDGQAPENILITEASTLTELQKAGAVHAARFGIEGGSWSEVPPGSGKYRLPIIEGAIYITIEP